MEKNLLDPNYNLSSPANFTPLPTTPNAPKPVTTTGVVSSEQGANLVTQKTKQLSNLTGTNTATATGSNTEKVPTNTGNSTGGSTTPQMPTAPSSKLTLINPVTGQTSNYEGTWQLDPKTNTYVPYDNIDLNKSNIQALMNAGYKVESSSGSVPSWLTASSTGIKETPESKLQGEIDKLSSDIGSLTSDLSKYTISDAQLSETVKNITAQFDTRIEDMKKINSARASSINTTGIRLGSQFAGGAGGVFGGIVTEEERQGVSRIAELEAQKQSAISAAKTAAAQQNWQVFSKQVDMAQKAYEGKVAELEKLNKSTLEQNKLIADNLKALKEANAKVTAEKVKNINEVLTSARKNGAPIDVIKAIQDVADSGGDVADAVVAAGNYGTEASGTLGEFYQYKREGGTMSWKDYKNWDDNNKAKVQAAINSAGLNKDQANKVAGLLDDYDKAVKDIKTVLTSAQTISALAEKAKSSNTDAGTRAASQIALIFSFMKVLDPSSTVREGEYATAQNTAGVEQKIRNAYNKAVDGSFLGDGQIEGYKQTAEALAEVRRRNKEQLDTEYDRRAGLYGIARGTITGGSDKLIQSETADKQKVATLVSDPKQGGQIKSLIQGMETVLGRKITATEFLERYPEYNK